jgi:dynactin complex subunit
MGDMETVKEEVALNRKRYHELSSEVGIIKGKTEILETKIHHCSKEQDFGTLWEILKNHTNHVTEGERVGGFRDEFTKAKIEIKALKERFWQSSLIGGVIGALIGSGSKDAIGFLIKWMVGK